LRAAAPQPKNLELLAKGNRSRMHSRHYTLLLLLAAMLLPTRVRAQSTDRDLGVLRIRYVTIVVRDYDEALRWYTTMLGFEKTEDGTFGKGQRWLVVAPRGRKDLGIVLEIAKPYSVGENMSAQTTPDSIRNYENRVARPQERKFLGFSFTAGPEVKRVIAPKAVDRFKQRIRAITRRAKGVSMEMTMEELAPYMRGWRSISDSAKRLKC
jgi:catechol 2,3-dioxygenase-like lactoylglutathione lyase family enzyme